MRRWTGSWAAGYTAGSLAAFNAHVLVRLAHLQAQHVEFVALMLFALDRVVISRRARDAVWLGVAFALEGLTSVYLLVFSTWLLIFATAARARGWLRDRPGQVLARLALAGATAVALLAPYLFGYLLLRRTTGFERSIEDNVYYSGSWVDYLSTGARAHFGLWSQPFFERAMSSGFPGVLGITLAVLGCAWPETRRDPRLRMCGVAAVGCLAVAMVPRTPIFPLLFAAVPLFRAVRVPAHLSQIVLLMIAVMAGFGVSGLARRWGRRRWWPAVAVVLCLSVNLEALRAPLELRYFDRIPAIYDRVASMPGAVLMEWPFLEPVSFFGNAGYMLNSTRHWRPMLNGYSGFRPESYDATFRAIQGFPDLGALAALHERGVTHVVVHRRETAPAVLRALDQQPALDLVVSEDEIDIYRLK